ncbi:MAG: nitrile hydratase subunit beta [Leptothrix sp. (in: Bacteria)]|nr:nitrile hydratase subunit beta [Leptothrix sp. (in: b-proteobacteria)]
MTAYTSHADLGGRPGHGAVTPEPEGELWHAPWEPRAMALTVAMGATGAWNIDMSRAAREMLPDYARLGYYEIWIHALERLLFERGLLHADELAQGRALRAAPPLPRTLAAAAVPAVLARGAPTARALAAPPRHAVGDRVRLLAGAVPHHTRLPAYARGRSGVVQAWHGGHVLADSHAQGLGEQPAHLYTVALEGRELWGDEAGARGLLVHIDVWEPHMEPA